MTKDEMQQLAKLASNVQRHEVKIDGDLEKLGMRELTAELEALLRGGR